MLATNSPTSAYVVNIACGAPLLIENHPLKWHHVYRGILPYMLRWVHTWLILLSAIYLHSAPLAPLLVGIVMLLVAIIQCEGRLYTSRSEASTVGLHSSVPMQNYQEVTALRDRCPVRKSGLHYRNMHFTTGINAQTHNEIFEYPSSIAWSEHHL